MNENVATSAIVDGVIRSRRSVRGFLPTPIPQTTISEIIETASRAPSGSNIQPWQVYVVTGSAKERLTQELLDVFNDPDKKSLHTPEYAYYPKTWVEPFLSRRRKVGFDLYAQVGILRGQTQEMHRQHAKNFAFFGAPVALFFSIPRQMEQGSWLDYGMFLQNILIAAQARGLSTCPQAAFISYHQIVAAHLGFTPNEQLVCCISLGYEDKLAPANQLVTERKPLSEMVHFLQE